MSEPENSRPSSAELLIVNGNYPGTPVVAIVLVFGVLSMVAAIAYGKLLTAR